MRPGSLRALATTSRCLLGTKLTGPRYTPSSLNQRSTVGYSTSAPETLPGLAEASSSQSSQTSVTPPQPDKLPTHARPVAQGTTPKRATGKRASKSKDRTGSGQHRPPSTASGDTTGTTSAPQHAVQPKKLQLADDLEVEVYPHRITLVRPNGLSLSFSAVRLLDNCQCTSCIQASTGQRNHTSAQAWRATRRFDLRQHVSVTDQGLQIRWRNLNNPEGREPHVYTYTLDALRAMSPPGEAVDASIGSEMIRTYWRGSAQLLDMGEETISMPYSSLRRQNGSVNDEQLLIMLRQVQQYGLVILRGVPTAETSNEACELRKFASLIGEIRNSFYGETWDVINMPNSKNVAYTNANLGLHMDLLYFQNPPRFQALHCLRARVSGGKSAFVDAMAVAQELRLEDPHAYARLHSPHCRVLYEYDNDGHHLHWEHPILHMYNYPRATQHLRDNVAWSPPFRGVQRVRSDAPGVPAGYEDHDAYAAIAKFDEMLNRPSARHEFLLSEGDLVFFDNRRILHAREEFRDWTEEERKAKGIEVKEGEPSRWLKGLYLEGDVVWDKLRVLHKKHGEGQ